jgi:uncharacterized Zn finger protein (UPF0148 family)
MTMPRNSTTARTETRRTGRTPAGHRKPAAGKPGRRAAAEQPAQPKQTTQPKRQAAIEVDDEFYEEADLGDVVPAVRIVQSSSEARKRLEMLREERMLQQALSDTFDP